MTYSKCFECESLTNLVCADCDRNGQRVYVCEDCRDKHWNKSSCTYRVGGPIVVRAVDLPAIDCGPPPTEALSWTTKTDDLVEKYLGAYRVTLADVRRSRAEKRAGWLRRLPAALLLFFSAAGCVFYARLGDAAPAVTCGFCTAIWFAVLALDVRRDK